MVLVNDGGNGKLHLLVDIGDGVLLVLEIVNFFCNWDIDGGGVGGKGSSFDCCFNFDKFGDELFSFRLFLIEILSCIGGGGGGGGGGAVDLRRVDLLLSSPESLFDSVDSTY